MLRKTVGIVFSLFVPPDKPKIYTPVLIENDVMIYLQFSSIQFQEEEDYDSRGVRRKTWDDEHVLKRQFSALVPAFDPRPGRTNVQQTTDLEIPPPGKCILSINWV